MRPVVLTTPSLGVRIDRAADGVWLRYGNAGGRGSPSHLLLIPVEVVDADRLAWRIDPDEMVAGDSASRTDWNVYCRPLPTAALIGPEVQAIPQRRWHHLNPDEGPLLVVLVFNEGATFEGEFGNRFSPAARQVLRDLLDRPDKAAWRRRGLARLASRPPQGIAPGPAPVVFALASCQYPAGILDATPHDEPVLDRATPCGPADASLLRLYQRLVRGPAAQRPDLLLLAGDQIYVDATAGLFDPSVTVAPRRGRSAAIDDDWLRLPYVNWLGSVGVQSAFGLVRVQTMIDDHEIGDNWEPTSPKPNGSPPSTPWSRRCKAAKVAYRRYEAAPQQEAAAPDDAPLWGCFEHQGARFFLSDTRTEREPRRAGGDPYTPGIMSLPQTRALWRWLRGGGGQPAFVLSPSILLPRRLGSARSARAAIHSDAWDGYPGSLERLLIALCRRERRGVVFLSGDEHFSCVVKATVTEYVGGQAGRSVVIHSIHSSGLYSPYPFANSTPEDLAGREGWWLGVPTRAGPRYRCDVEVIACEPGDGFAVLRLEPDVARSTWTLDVAFDREERSPAPIRLDL